MQNQPEHSKIIDFKEAEKEFETYSNYRANLIWHIFAFGGLGLFAYFNRPHWVLLAVVVAFILFFPLNPKALKSD